MAKTTTETWVKPKSSCLGENNVESTSNKRVANLRDPGRRRSSKRGGGKRARNNEYAAQKKKKPLTFKREGQSPLRTKTIK